MEIQFSHKKYKSTLLLQFAFSVTCSYFGQKVRLTQTAGKLC